MNRRDFLTKPLLVIAKSKTSYSRPSKPLALTGLEPYTGAWTYAEASHLLRRTMFGAKKADVDAILAKTKDQAIDMLFSPVVTPAEPIIYVGTNSGASWVSQGFSSSDATWFTFLQTWFFQQMVIQPISISEKMTLFWTNHFATGYNSVKDSRYMYKQNAMLRKNALGNFKALAKEVTLDNAMLVYLNGFENKKSGPNENYGRELQELFTIGKGPLISPGNYTNYTEDDIKAVAKVLTGWGVDATNLTYKFTASDHDTSNKQFSSCYGNTVIQGRAGQSGAMQELDDLLTMIFNQQATALYICRKIYRWFVATEVTPEIEQNVIIPLADILKQGGYEIKPVLDKLLKSAHFFDMANRGGLVKNPIDLGIGLMRGVPTDAFHDYKDGNGNPIAEKVSFLPTELNQLHWAFRPYRRTLATMQLDLFNPPNVAGLPAYYQTPQFDELWINSDTLQKRIKLIDDFCVVNYKWDEEYGHFLLNTIEFAKQSSAPQDAVKLIDDWMMMLFPFAMSSDQKQTARGVMLGALNDTQWTTMWNDYIQSPTNDTKAKAVDDRLRPLLRHLLGLAEYQLM